MDRDMIADKLTRALAMEETMAGLLIEICSSPRYLEALPQDTRVKIADILSTIKQDTMRHKEVVFQALAKYKR